MLSHLQQLSGQVQDVGSFDYLHHGLVRAEHLAAHAGTRTLALALDTLGNLTLPPPSTADDQAHLRTLASLYLCSQLELASLLPAVELLAGMGVGGGLSLDLGPAASKLMQFYLHRKERFSPEERQALFQRLFNEDFENLMISLCEALYKLDEGVIPQGAGNPLEQAKVRSLGEQLTEHLLNHATAESSFAATDILAATRTATNILNDPRVERALHSQSIWQTVASILQRYGTPGRDPTAYVIRGKAGLTLLAWLSDVHAVSSATPQPLVGLDHPVIGAAVDWLQSSLTIEQNKAADKHPQPSQPGSSAPQPVEAA